MGKSHKKRKRQRAHSTDGGGASEGAAANNTNTNALLKEQQKFLNSISKEERNDLFSPTFNPERRGELWSKQADLGERLINRYSWATPDERCLRILKHFSPLVEIGCGANAYWSQYMANTGIDVVAYDVDPHAGGTILESDGADGGKGKKKHKKHQSDFTVQKGGPQVLEQEKNRTLFLCYPDEDGEVTVGESEEAMSMGSACLEFYTGDVVIHVGELFGDTLAVDQAPWGRSSGPDFQVRLASEFHCILKASLSNWLHVRDTISVWKRTQTCPIVFAAESDDEEEDEEIEYRYIPESERLPADIAAPCLAHLLKDETNGSSQHEATVATNNRAESKKKQVDKKNGNESTREETGDENNGYVCPW